MTLFFTNGFAECIHAAGQDNEDAIETLAEFHQLE